MAAGAWLDACDADGEPAVAVDPLTGWQPYRYLLRSGNRYYLTTFAQEGGR